MKSLEHSTLKWINHSNGTLDRIDSIVNCLKKVFHSSYLYLSVFPFVLSIFCKKGINFFVYITFYFDKYVTKTTRHIGNHTLLFSIMDLPKFGKMWNGLKLFKTWQWLQICWETWQIFFCFKFSAKNVSILQGGYSSLVVAKATKYSSGWALIMFVCVHSLKYN